MYPDYMQESLKKVVATRNKRFDLAKSGKPVYPPMNAEEREDVLNKFHPDFKKESRKKIFSLLLPPLLSPPPLSSTLSRYLHRVKRESQGKPRTPDAIESGIWLPLGLLLRDYGPCSTK